ncbi:MAG: biotin/lipoyl-binding protein, partial [Thermodesulfobacteriota bacterium]
MTRLLLLLIVVVPAAAAAWYAWRPQPLMLPVQPAELGVIERTVVNTRAGSVAACRRALLSPSVGGRITAWPTREGMRVMQGDLLLALWNEDLEAAVVLARAEAASARAREESVCQEAG